MYYVLVVRNTSTFATVVLLAAGILLTVTKPNGSGIVFSAGLGFALGWLLIASFLIRKAHIVAERFFAGLPALVVDREHLPAMRDREMSAMKAPGFILLSTFLAMVAFLLPLLADYRGRLAPNLWSALVFATVFFYAGIAVRSLNVVRRIVFQLADLDLRINEFDPDRMGGLGPVRQFIGTAALFWFTGGLLLPAAWELAQGQPKAYPLVIAFLISYFLVGIGGYFWVLHGIMMRVSGERNRILQETATQLKDLYDKGADTASIQRFQIRNAAAEKMKRLTVDLSDWLPWLSALLGLLPIVLTHVAPSASWAASILLVIPIIKDVLSKS